MDSKFWEDVQVGEVLPTLHFPITIKTLTLAVAGTRDLMPYHHDSAYSKSLGNRDMFVNTMFELALFGRYTTDWCGPESDFRETRLQMLDQLCPGDVAVIEGSVRAKERSGDDYQVKVDLKATNHIGVAARFSATLAMPSRRGGAVVPKLELAKPQVEVHPEIPDFAKAWLGASTPLSPGAYPVSEAQIMYWCDMVEDANPLYADGEYARNSRHGGIVAPPLGLVTWAASRAGHQGVNRDAPDHGSPDRKPWPPKATDAKPRTLGQPPGTTDTIAQISVQTYGKLLRPGDRVFQTSEVVNCSPQKQTKLGPGYFQTNLVTFYNQKEEIVGTNLFTLLRFGGNGGR